MRGGIFLIACAIALCMLLFGIEYFFDCSGWPTANGAITEANVQEQRQRGVGNAFSMKLKYEYEVDGKKYQGNRIGMVNYTFPTRNSLVAKQPYFSGKPVEVYYNPKSPKSCYLQPGFNLGIHRFLWPSLIALAGVFFGVISFFVKDEEEP